MFVETTLTVKGPQHATRQFRNVVRDYPADLTVARVSFTTRRTFFGGEKIATETLEITALSETGECILAEWEKML
jgi:hypothetical protein